jgi:type I restriction enzyme R subunit
MAKFKGPQSHPFATAIETRAIFYRRLLPLLEFGREREEIDLSKVVLTRHRLYPGPGAPMVLKDGPGPKLDPAGEVGSGEAREKTKIQMAALIEHLNELFGVDTTEQDQLVYVNHVLKGKLLESQVLQQQAASNTKEQFATSPDLNAELLNAIMSALDAHTSMSTKALNSPRIQAGLKDILLNHAALWETLREAKPA